MDCLSNYTADVPKSLSNGAKIAADPAKGLGLGQAIALREALGTIHDVVCGLVCQPRFRSHDGEMNAAADELEPILEWLDVRMDDLVSIIRATRPEHNFDRRRRAAFLATHEIENDGGSVDTMLAPYMAAQV
jgi:hypothetical protein